MFFSDLCTDVSRELFLNILRSHRWLNHLLPAYRPLDALRRMRPRGHNFILPECLSNLHKRSLIVSCLCEFVWYVHTVFPRFMFSSYTSHVDLPGLLPLLVQCSVFCCVPAALLFVRLSHAFIFYLVSCTLGSRYPANSSLKIPPRLRRVATLPCEILLSAFEY